MVGLVFLEQLLTLAVPIFLISDARSSCDAQQKPGRFPHSIEQQVPEGYLLLPICLHCKHVSFLLGEFWIISFSFPTGDRFPVTLDCRENLSFRLSNTLLCLAWKRPGKIS